MDELTLDEVLYHNILDWMQNKYAVGTIKNRSYKLKKMFQTHKVLSRDNIKNISREFKHPQDKAILVMLNWYCDESNIDFNIRVPRMKYKKARVPELLSASEVRLMVESAPYPYDLAIRCIFNIGAGLRISEIIKMSWDHIRWIDWLNNQESYGVAIVKQGKGAKDRVVNIPNNLMKDLYQYAKEINTLNEFRIPTGTFMFTFGGLEGNQGKSIRYLKEHLNEIDDIWKEKYVKVKYNWFRYNIMQKCCEQALNKKINIHQLRHSRATYLYEIEKQSLANIQKLLGHASIETTMRYIQVDLKGVFDSMKNTMEI